MTIGQSESGAALTFLRDLRKRGIDLQELVDCLKVIKCQPALNFFIQGASRYWDGCKEAVSVGGVDGGGEGGGGGGGGEDSVWLGCKC